MWIYYNMYSIFTCLELPITQLSRILLSLKINLTTYNIHYYMFFIEIR